jgi:nitrous oxidase accessory protein NosD
MRSRVFALCRLAYLAAAVTALPAQAVQRSFVASYGNDANTATNCTFANPCRGFSAALTVTDSGGEIVALDAAGYGKVTITKSVTITANPGFYAGISTDSGPAIGISMPGIDVILRGLSVNGIGGTNGNGVQMTAGHSLTIENCVFSNFSSTGVIAALAGAAVRISDSTFRGNSTGLAVFGGATLDVARSSFKGNIQSGVSVGDGSTGTVSDSVATGNGLGMWVNSFNADARLVVTRSTASNNSSAGLAAEMLHAGMPTLVVSGNLVTGNSNGLMNLLGTLESQGNNTVRQNETNVSGAITTISGM